MRYSVLGEGIEKWLQSISKIKENIWRIQSFKEVADGVKIYFCKYLLSPIFKKTKKLTGLWRCFYYDKIRQKVQPCYGSVLYLTGLINLQIQ